MKNHIIFKFIAVLLCAAFLLGAVGSGCGILLLAEQDMYNRSYEEVYDEMVESRADGLAYNVGIRYASGALGGCPTQLLDAYYGTGGYYDIFDMSKVGYTLKDTDGEVLQRQALDPGTTPEYTFSFPAGRQYLRLVEQMPYSQWQEMQNPVPEETYIDDSRDAVLYDAVPSEGADVYNMSVTFPDGSGEGVGSDEPFAHLSYDEEGWLTCLFYGGFDPVDHVVPTAVTRIVFKDEYDNVLFEAKDDAGVGELIYAGGDLMFRSSLAELYAPQIEEETAQEMGARAIVQRKTPIWTLIDGEFEKQGYYYGKDYDVTIYATKVYEGVLYGCTTQGYLTSATYRSEWVDLADVTFVKAPAGSGNGMRAICNNRTEIWALDEGECYDTGMYYQEGQEIGILVLGTFESGEWGLTDLGWVQLSDVTLLQQTAIEYELDSTKAVTNLRTPVYDIPAEDSEIVEYLPKGTEVTIQETETHEDIRWGLIGDNWIQMEYVTLQPTIQEPEEASGSATTAFATNVADIFSAPNGEVLGQLNPGETFTVLRQENTTGIDWILMDRGWVMAASVTIQDPIPQVTSQIDTPAEQAPQTFVTTDEVNVWTNPNPNSDPLVLLPADTLVEVLRLENMNGTDWALTRQGWIQAEFLMAEAAATEVTDPTEETEATDVPELEFHMEPLDPTEEMVDLEESQDGPVQEVDSTEPAVAAAPYQEDEATAPTIMPKTAAMEERDLEYVQYYDHDTDTSMMAGVVYETMPEGYTVELQLAKGALRYQHEWELFRLLYDYRSQMPRLLIISLLGLAICVVYLCCAAGKKPGTKEIRAGGLNRLPLDLYFALDCAGVAAAMVLAVAAVEELSRKNLQVAAGTALGMAYCASLLVVGFFFALVAQIKTPGGFWWRNSLCGWCWRLLCRCCRWLLRGYEKLGVLYDEKGEAAILKFFKNCWKLILFFWGLLVRICKWCYNTIIKGTEWIGNKFLRFFSMLPLTWQWLVTGFAMLLMVAMVFATNGEELLVLICVVGSIAIILYGAHAFGVLLEGVKRMNKGDLDEKVDDKLLIGSFKDFSDELNGLANVAVIAAQKQLKSERMKTELITNVSHDIKTPLTSIINYVDLMQRPHSDEEQEQYLEVLDRQSQRLKKLIDDLMEMSKASTGNLTVDIGVVNAGEAVNQALGEFADKLEKAELYPVFRQPEKPVEMMADGRLVWRVMSNLLSNAVKYALPGTRLYVDLAAVDGKVIISLKNISREELNVHADELLERFVRGDASRNTEGSGLGLNIAQSLMELQKGQLQLLVDGDLFKVTLIFPGV